MDLRRTVATVAALNLAAFGGEIVVALAIGSVALMADSLDFLEDASINLLILLGLGRGALARARLGRLLALVVVLPSLGALWTAWQKLQDPVAPEPLALTLTAGAALLVNLLCALLIARHRHAGGSLTRAAFLSARNDVVANAAIILAGLVTAFLWRSGWPDLLVGLAILALNATAAREVWEAADEEAEEPTP
jgi:Co/Zn/Cd efflux system component